MRDLLGGVGASPMLRLGAMTFDPHRGLLSGPSGREVTLRPKTAEVLRTLAERAGSVVSREALIDAVWPGVFVTDDSLTQCITEIRRALGEDGASLLRTLPKRGYLFAMSLAAAEQVAGATAAAATPVASGAAPPSPGAVSERRLVSVLVCASDGAASDNPEDLREMILAFRSEASREIARHGGHVVTSAADWTMGLFGWPAAQEDHAERALRAALAIAGARAGDHGARRAGVATGDVVVASDGAGPAEVTGEVVGLALRLHSAAPSRGVLTDQLTRRLVGDLFNIVVAEEGQTGSAFRVDGEGPVESRWAALRHATAHVGMAGREEERGALLRRWRRVQDGTGQVALICGEPGIGKSRLAVALREDALGADAKARGVDWFAAAHLAESPFHPIISWLRRRSGMVAGDSPERARQRLAEALASAAPTEVETDALADLLGLPGTSGENLDPRGRRAAILGALVRWIEAEARRAPLLVTLEDIHWADASTRELADLIVRLAERAPVLLVMTHRPSHVPPWTGFPHVTELRLARLGRDDTASLVDALAADHPLAPEVRAAIVQRCDGVPLFAEELTLAVLEAATRNQGGRPSIHAIPSTLVGSLMARLDRLGRTAMTVAQAAAAIGREFEHEVIAAVTGLPESELDKALGQLSSAGLVLARGVPPDTAYSFKHALVRDAAYEALLRDQRQALHSRIVAELSRLRPDLAERQPEVLAAHCAAAGDDARALSLWEAAGERALTRYALAEAASHLRQAAAHVRRMPASPDMARRELGILFSLGQTLFSVVGPEPETADAFARAISLAQALGDEKALCRATYGIYTQHMLAGELRLILGLGAELERFAETYGSVEARICAGRILGTTRLLLGELALAEQDLTAAISLQLRRGLPHDDRAYAHHPGLTAPAPLALVAWARGEPERATRLAAEAIDAGRGFPDVNSLLYCLHLATLLNLLLGRPEEALALVDEALGIARSRGAGFWQLRGSWTRSAALVLAGDLDDGRRDLAAALERTAAHGGRQFVPLGFCILADAALRVGDAAAAEAALASAQDIIAKTEQNVFLPDLRRLQARLLARAGHHDDAAAVLEDGLAIARRQGAAGWEPRLLAEVAAIRQRAGRARGAMP